MYWTPDKIVVAFVAGQGEVIEIGLGIYRNPIMVAQRGKKPIEGCTGTKGTLIGIDKFMSPVIQARLLIMATYISAQFLIVKGILIHENEKAT